MNREGKDLDEMWNVIRALRNEEDLNWGAYRDHELHGEWAGVRELHLGPDWLLAYRIEDEVLILVRTGSHSDLFRSWN